ncbi:AAA family ATPase, partial [Spirillospora sp. NPDC049652]
RRLQSAARAAADRREELARLRGRVEALRSKAQAGQSEIGRLSAARAEAEQRAATAQEEFEAFEAEVVEDPALAAEHESAQDLLAAAKETAETARAAVDLPRQALKDARAAVAAARSADQGAQKRVAALQARIEALNLTLASAADGGEALLASGLDGVLGTVASLLNVRPGYETAVAAALGDATQAIAVGSLDTAEAALSLLRAKDAGRAGLLIGGPSGSSGPAGAVERFPGIDYAIDAVTVPGEVRPAMEFLLRDVAVADDVTSAAKLVRAHPSLRVVTRDGDLVGAYWARGGGAGGAQSILQMRATLDEATADLAAAESAAERGAADLAEATEAEQQAQLALDAAQAAVGEAQSGVNAAQAELDRIRARVREVESQAAQEARRAARLEADVRAARGEVERLGRALDAAAESREADLEAAEDLAMRLEEAEEAANVADEAGEDTSVRDELAARVQQLRSAEMEARLSVRTAEERVQAIAGRADALERGARREREERARAARRRARREQQAKIAEAVHRGSLTALARLEQSLASAVTQREAAEEARAARESELRVIRTQVRELSSMLERLVNVVHGNEVARAEQRLRLEQMEQRALEEFGLEIDALVGEYGPDQPVPPGPEAPEDAQPVPYERTTQEKRAKKAERELNQLGKINPLALEEFAALEERHAFLTSQLEDLKKTRRDLLLVVKEVDDRVQQVFGSAYADTAREFERIFARLFPGGEGSLSLTEPDDMLTTGVEVAARPPGKKVKRLSLLSGGERSLVAIAFLVAVFKARPSPFYVLDEVEAALDDTNTQRLITVFEELRESSQLIVITHQKRTMEGADALYGVSMRGDGVTQVISQRLVRDEPEPRVAPV